MDVLKDVKAVFSWIFPLKSSHGKLHCDNRLPAERTKSESSVPTMYVQEHVCFTVCVPLCVSVCVQLDVTLVWIIFNTHSC